MPNTDYDQDTYTFAFLSGAQPTTHDATCRFLKGATPLKMRGEHVLNKMCPDAFAPREGVWYEVAGIKVCALFMGGASFASDTLDISLALPLAPGANGTKWIDKVAKAIADSGGLKLAWEAFLQRTQPDEDAKRLFFIAMGQTWCQKDKAVGARAELLTDQHPPARFRVEGTLSQFPPFAETFNCPAGARMNPAERCHLW